MQQTAIAWRRELVGSMHHGNRGHGHRRLGHRVALILLTASLGITARAEAPPPPPLDAPPPPSGAEQLGTIRLEEESRQQAPGTSEVPVDHLRPRRQGPLLPGVAVEEGLIFQPEVGPDTIQPGVEVKGMLRLDLDR